MLTKPFDAGERGILVNPRLHFKGTHMKAIYTEVLSNNKNQYVVTIAYEHGDADITTYNTYTLNDVSEDALFDFVKRVNKTAEHIEMNRHYSVKFPDEFYSLTKTDNGLHQFDLEYDKKYSSAGEYYAAMSIDSIVYYNHNGTTFDVAIVQDDRHA